MEDQASSSSKKRTFYESEEESRRVADWETKMLIEVNEKVIKEQAEELQEKQKTIDEQKQKIAEQQAEIVHRAEIEVIKSKEIKGLVEIIESRKKKQLEELFEVRGRQAYIHEAYSHPTKLSEWTISQLYDSKMYIPDAHKKRILRLYGGFLIEDIDNILKLNDTLGNIGRTSYHSMAHYFRTNTREQIHADWRKIGDPPLQDAFNILATLVVYLSKKSDTNDHEYDPVWFE